MLVSIIIPVYNVAEYIERCLVSVFQQTYQNIEIILIDDCSPDKSMEIAKSLIKRWNKVDITKIFVHEQNKGLSAARNTGIDKSQGDYLFFLDSDDEIFPDAIDNLISLLQHNHIDFVVGGVEVIGNYAPIKLKTTSQYIESNIKIVESFSCGDWPVMAWNKLLNRRFVLCNNLFFEEGIFHEDVLWNFKLITKASKMAICFDKTYKYVIRENSIISTPNSKKINDLIFIYGKILEISKNNQKLYCSKFIIAYLEMLKFYILSMSVTYKEWVIRKILLPSITDLFGKTIFSSQISFNVKVKMILYKLPNTIGYILFLWWSKLKKNYL